jgi:hypothetical protein
MKEYHIWRNTAIIGGAFLGAIVGILNSRLGNPVFKGYIWGDALFWAVLGICAVTGINYLLRGIDYLVRRWRR